jgi:hypothetical protein
MACSSICKSVAGMKINNKLNLLVSFLLGIVIGGIGISKYYVIPKMLEMKYADEASYASLNAVLYKALKNEKYDLVLDALMNEVKLRTDNKDSILVLISNAEEKERAKTNLDKAENIINSENENYE